MSSSSTCGCCVCPTHADQAAGASSPQREDPVQGYLDGMLCRLEEQAVAGVEIAVVEDSLVRDVREVGRRCLQRFLDRRADQEERRREVTGSDGVRRTRVEGGHTRPLRSVFGEVTVTRLAYRARPVRRASAPIEPDVPVEPDVPGVPDGPDGELDRTPGNLYPADAVLNLPVGKDSWGLARLVVAEAARGSYEETVAAVERATVR